MKRKVVEVPRELTEDEIVDLIDMAHDEYMRQVKQEKINQAVKEIYHETNNPRYRNRHNN